MESPPDTGNHINAALGIPVDSQKTPDALMKCHRAQYIGVRAKKSPPKEYVKPVNHAAV
jgi:hypothetical protein